MEKVGFNPSSTNVWNFDPNNVKFLTVKCKEFSLITMLLDV